LAPQAVDVRDHPTLVIASAWCVPRASTAALAAAGATPPLARSPLCSKKKLTQF
jgi:hypothetical protein